MFIVRFENGKRIATIPIENKEDRKNKEFQAKLWKGNNPNRVYMITEKNEPYIKLVNGSIKKMTKTEIQKSKPKTSKEVFIQMLQDQDIKNEIIKIVKG